MEIGSRRLENAHRIALETEDVGADILRNLRGQREQIEHTRDTVSSLLDMYHENGIRESLCYGFALFVLADASGFGY
jgi:hypothetical protein